MEEVPPTRALNLRRFAEVQELPLQADPTVTNGQDLRLRLVAVEHGSSDETSFMVNALALERDIRGALPSPAHTTDLDPTADDAVDRFVEAEQMVVEAPQVEHAVPSLLELHSAQDLQLVSQASGLSLNDSGDDASRPLQRESAPLHHPAAVLSAAAVAVSAPVEGDTSLMFPPESYRIPNKPIGRSKEPPPPPSPRRLGASLFMISSEEGTLPNVISMLRRAHPQPYVLLYDQKDSEGRRSVICLCDSGAASFNVMAERGYLEARRRNPARFDTYHAYERPLPVSGIEASRKEVCIVGRTNQKLYCPITKRQMCFPTVILQNASTGDAEVIFGNRRGASDAWGSITDLGNMEYTIRQVGDGSPEPLILDMIWNPDAAAMQVLARFLINKEREACDVHLTSEEITHLVEASSSEQHSEELSEQPSGLISELPFGDLDEVLIKVAEVGLDLQEDSTKLPSEQVFLSHLFLNNLRARAASFQLHSRQVRARRSQWVLSHLCQVFASLQPARKHLLKLVVVLLCHGIQLHILFTRDVSANVRSASTRKLAKMSGSPRGELGVSVGGLVVSGITQGCVIHA